MPSTCKTILRFANTLPSAGSEWTFHYDPNTKRSSSRRYSICNDYINKKRPDGSPQCPEPDQPPWTGYATGSAVASGPHVFEVNPLTGMLGLSYQEISFNHDGTETTVTKWKDYGSTASCDEFPAARYVLPNSLSSNFLMY